MVHKYRLLALPLLMLDAARGVAAIPKNHAQESNPPPATLHVLPLIADISDDYHSWIAEVAAGTPPQKMRLNLDIAKSTTCTSLLSAVAVVITNSSKGSSLIRPTRNVMVARTGTFSSISPRLHPPFWAIRQFHMAIQRHSRQATSRSIWTSIATR